MTAAGLPPAGSRLEPPPGRLPVLYFAVAHVALGLAFLLVGLAPRAVAGFFYHSRIVAIVHLVTLGWISGSILGAFYVVSPMALRMSLPARRLDYWAFGLVSSGMAGMVTHFWIEEFSGMAWSGLGVAVGFTLVAIRVLPVLRGAPIPSAIKLHIALAFVNILAAGTAGVLLGFDKFLHFLPGFVLTNVFAHAHLAAVGWAGMLVVGIGYRLLPMVLPAAPPQGRGIAASALLLEAGVVGLFLSLFFRAGWWTGLSGATIASGFVVFLLHVVGMLRRPRPAPVARRRPDYAVRHAMIALACLGSCLVLGLVLAFAPTAGWTLRAALLYGTLGLVGFLSQLIVGMEIRILPVFAWYRAMANGAEPGTVPHPETMPDRALQAGVFWLWAAGLPLLASGLTFDAVPLLAAGAWMLFAATALGALNAGLVLMHARRTPHRSLAA
jgi:hypothetical protein